MKIKVAKVFQPAVRDIMQPPSERKTLEWFWTGGRDSGKTFTACLLALNYACLLASLQTAGVILMARSFYASLQDSLLQECRKVFDKYPDLAAEFNIGESFIRHKSGYVSFVFAGLNINSISLKGLSNVRLALVDEADGCNERGLEYFVPTIREEGALILWLSNPTTQHTPFARYLLDNRKLPIPEKSGEMTEAGGGLFRQLHVNYNDNPFLSTRSRLAIGKAKETMSPAVFENIYEGRYVLAASGGLFERELSDARETGRLNAPVKDLPELPLYATVDLGYSDMTSFCLWQYDQQASQFRIVDFVFGNGQTISEWLLQLVAMGYGRAKHFLPMDAKQTRGYTTETTACDIYSREGQPFELVPAIDNWSRVNELRTLFPRLIFGEKCERALHIFSFLRMKTVNGVQTNTIEHNTEGLPTKDIADPLLMLPYCESAVKRKPVEYRYESDREEKRKVSQYDY